MFLWDGSTIKTQTVTLGSIYGDGVEVTESFPDGYELIVSDIGNYDPEKMILEKK